MFRWVLKDAEKAQVQLMIRSVSAATCGSPMKKQLLAISEGGGATPDKAIVPMKLDIIAVNASSSSSSSSAARIDAPAPVTTKKNMEKQVKTALSKESVRQQFFVPKTRTK